MPRESWTDERLDDLSRKMDREFDLVRAEMKAGFDKVDARLEGIDDRFAALNRTLIGGGLAVCAAILTAGLF